MKRYFLLFFIAFLSLTAVLFYSCKKSNNNNGNNNGGTPAAGTGKFTLQGTTYGMLCVAEIDSFGCGGLIVGIVDTVGNTTRNFFAISSFPASSSGTYNFTDGYVGDSTCTLSGVVTIGYYNGYNTGQDYYTRSGTITKTGAKSFTFTCTVYDHETNANYSVSGSGTYKQQ